MKRTLKEIYRAIPAFTCRPGCTNCCGPVVFSDEEERRIAHPLPPREDLRCQYAVAGRCSVYSMRPFICRLFGACADMPCPWGCKPARVLSAAEANELTREYLRR